MRVEIQLYRPRRPWRESAHQACHRRRLYRGGHGRSVSFSSRLSRVKVGTRQKDQSKEAWAEGKVWGFFKEPFQPLPSFIVDRRREYSFNNFSTSLSWEVEKVLSFLLLSVLRNIACPQETTWQYFDFQNHLFIHSEHLYWISTRVRN